MAKKMQPQHVQTYKDATDNLMFLKKEQVQITLYTWTMLAALYLLSKNACTSDRIILGIGVVAVGLISTRILYGFQNAMDTFRKRLSYVYENYFDAGERKSLLLDAKSAHPSTTRVLMAACLIAAVFT